MLRALLIAAIVLATAAGCSSSSAKSDGGPGGGGASGAMNCRPLSDTGQDCYCSSTGSNSLSQCSGSSVAAADHGYCCGGGGYCTCWRTACVNVPSIGYCECGTPFDDTNPRVDSCPQPAGGTCCLDTGLSPGSCHCSANVTSCPSGQSQVASCSLADVMICRSTDTVVASCK
jgi:hypothetical protein